MSLLKSAYLIILIVRFTLNPVFKEIFPKEYYSSDPPKGPNGTAAKVYVAFHIMDVDEISEANMVRL